MSFGNEVIWSALQKECVLEQMRHREAATLLEEGRARRTSRSATRGRRLRAQLGCLLAALGRRLASAAASLTAERI